MMMTPYDLLMVAVLSIMGLICVVQFIGDYSRDYLALATIDIGLVLIVLSIIGHVTSCISDKMDGKFALIGLMIALVGMLLQHFENIRFNNKNDKHNILKK